MIQHYYDGMGGHRIIIACGCCRIQFITEVGGSAFCPMCVHGTHAECNVPEIMGMYKS